jgi:hypothetical protein
MVVDSVAKQAPVAQHQPIDDLLTMKYADAHSPPALSVVVLLAPANLPWPNNPIALLLLLQYP